MLERFRNADLTSGSLIKPILWLAVPTMAGNLLQSAFNIADMYFVSRLGTAAIAAVSVAGLAIWLVWTTIIGVAIGSQALVTRFHGARDDASLRRAMITTLAASVLLTVLMAAGGPAVGKPLLKLLGAEAHVVDLAYGYIVIFFLGGFAFVFMVMINAMIRGMGDSVTPTLIVAGAVLLNVALDPVLIFGLGPAPELGVRGAALATVLAYTVGLVAAAVVFIRRHLPWRAFTVSNLSGRMALQVLTIGIPASAQMLIRAAAAVVLVGFVASAGTAAIAAYGIGGQLTGLMLMPGFALAMSAAILVGQNLGAGKKERAERTAMTSVGLYAVIVAAMAAGLVLFARYWVGIFDDTPAVVELGVLYLYICAPAYIFVPPGMVLSRSMSGAGVSVPPLIVTAVVLLGVRIPLAYVLADVMGMGVTGVYWAVTIPTVLEGVVMYFVFRTGVWKRRKL
ncbi:MAG: MATE family efflux transporter [Candidatus Zixiibacteriota bacterium]|jgi:putative MATE family efflux protein